MSTSGSKSNEHVAHFLVDIHTYSEYYHIHPQIVLHNITDQRYSSLVCNSALQFDYRFADTTFDGFVSALDLLKYLYPTIL